MKYSPLFSLKVTHSYYTDKRCTDFIIEPNQETHRRLMNHRSLLKLTPDGLRVFTVVVDDGRPLIPLSEDEKFSFQMRLQNPEFALFTELEDFSNKAAPLFTNAALNANSKVTLSLDSRSAAHTDTFTVVHLSPNINYALSMRPAKDRSTDVFQLGGTANIQFKGYDPDGNTIFVDTADAQLNDAFSVTYPVTPRIDKGTFADIEIHNTGNRLSSGETPVELLIKFTAKRAHWAYYLISDHVSNDQSFRIVDHSPNGDNSAVTFSEANQRNLVDDPDPKDTFAKALEEKYPDLKRIRFVSDSPIACREAARQYLELHLNGERLPGVLPNPSIRNLTKIEIKDGQNQPLQDTFFQVIKHLTHRYP